MGFECPSRDGLTEECRREVLLHRDSGEGCLVAAGVQFPEREVSNVGLLIAAESRRLDAVRVVGFPLRIDEFIISRPRRASFGFEKWAKEDDTAVTLAELAEDGFWIGGEKEVR